MPDYLKLPLQFGQFFQKEPLDKVSLKDSVFRNLHLLLTSRLGEQAFDERYGAGFWDADYDIHLSNDQRRELVAADARRLVLDYEKRLQLASVDVTVRQAEVQSATAGAHLRRRIDIVIKGRLVRTNEPFRFDTGFYIGPMSFD